MLPLSPMGKVVHQRFQHHWNPYWGRHTTWLQKHWERLS